MSFPPAGIAYGDRNTMESHYLWRWIGMHAPDLVVDVHSGKTPRWFIPSKGNLAKSGIKTRLSLLEDGIADELSAALVQNAPCETGTIDALRVTTVDGKSTFLPELLSALSDSKFRGPSPARREVQRRLARSPIQVADQLSKHYGHELKQVVYIPAVALIGRVRLGELTGDKTHMSDVRQIVAPYFDGNKATKPKSGSGLSGHLIFSELAADTDGLERERFVRLARNAADLAFGHQGKPNPSMPFHSEMSDALFMGGPILAHVGQLTGDEKYFDACVKHLRFMRKLVLRSDGLYRHSPLDEAAWGRGNGFPAIGLALCLTHWPKQRSDRAELLEMFQQHMSALATNQDPNGCWHQVIDHPESYRELTSTCMIAFAMARGVRNGWLERERFQPVIDKAWYAIRTRIGPDGHLVDVCTGTGKQKNLRAYYDRNAILGRDPRGGAMALLTAAEIAEFLEFEAESD
jgi:unsaturated rhamnogalacturonyl hydrolase